MTVIGQKFKLNTSVLYNIVLSFQEAASMASLISGLSSQLPGGHIDGSALPPVGELDPATGLFYNPSSSKYPTV